MIKDYAAKQQQFDFVITEISAANHRSLRAHQKTGFITIAAHTDDLNEWAVIL